jgi:hypothetical protein
MAEPTAVLIFDDVVRIIQSALAPVFLLAGTAGFLNAFSSRLARVADRVNTITDLIAVENGVSEAQMSQLAYLRRRTLALEAAVVLATLAGVCTCLATLGLLSGALREEFSEETLFWFFGGAVASLIGALCAFLYEMLVASTSLLKQIAEDKRAKRGRGIVRKPRLPESIAPSRRA